MSENYVLITGASGGLGYELACLFAQKHRHLILLARSEDKLKKLQQNLTEQYGIKAEILVIDLSRPDAINSVIAFLDRLGANIDTLINNAGAGCYGEFAASPLDELMRNMNLNMLSVVALTHSLLPRLIQHPAATIMNISSAAAFQPVPLLSVYAATKAFIVAFSEGLATELTGSPVKVVCFCPGQFASGFHKHAGMVNSRILQFPMPSARTVALQAYTAFEGKQSVVVGGMINKLFMFLTKLTPACIGKPVTYFLMKPVKK